MTAKRFILYEHKDNDYILDNPNVHLDFIEMLGDALTSEEIVDLLNELHEENEQLRNDNLKTFALLGDIRALLQNKGYDTVIKKINKFEKEVLK